MPIHRNRDSSQSGAGVKAFAVYWLPFILYAAVIFTVSSISRLPTPDIGIAFADKLAHFIEYFIFILLALRAFHSSLSSGKRLHIYLPAIVFSVVFAALDEFHQSVVPGRQADTFDLIADLAGILSGAALHLLIDHVKRYAPPVPDDRECPLGTKK